MRILQRYRKSAEVPIWPQIGGLLLAAAASMAVAWFGRGLLVVPSPIVLLVVVCSGFVGGLRAALLAAAAGCFYFLGVFSSPDHLFGYTADNLRRAIAWGGTTAVTALLVGALKYRADRVFEIATENAVLLDRVAEREHAARELRESERRNRSLFDDAPIALVRTSAEGQILDANPAAVAMFGFGHREAMLVANVNALCVEPRDLARALSALESGGDTVATELHVRRPDGETVWIRATVRAVRDAAHRLSHYESTAVELTRQPEAEHARDLLVAIVEAPGDTPSQPAQPGPS
ncbi:MAG TPA: PAS domain-containing protein [bacterium]|nr:PAS domain-containing protein [bacterium]